MLPWFNVWDGLKNKTCRYLLQRYLGQFLEDKLNLEQLNVELYNGKATVRDVSLNCKSLNELCEAQGWGVEVTGGRIGLIQVTVPWNAIMTNDSSIEVSDLFISLRPVKRQTDGSSMLESMWSSVSSSMQLAQECLETNATDDDYETKAQSNSIEGLERFAQTIDSVLNRIKAKCRNSEIRLEYLPPGSTHGVAIVMKIMGLSYRNEAGSDEDNTQASNQCREEVNVGEGGLHRLHTLSTFAAHDISFEGLQIYSEEFKVSQPSNPPKEQPMKESTIYTRNIDLDGSMNEPFYSMTSTTDQSSYTESLKRTQDTTMTASQTSSSSSRRSRTPTALTSDEDSDPEDETTEEPTAEVFRSKSILFMRVDGKTEIKIKMKQREDVTGAKVSLDVKLGAYYLFGTPRQIHLLKNFCTAYLAETGTKDLMTSARNDPLQGQPAAAASSSSKSNFSSNMTGILGGQGNWGEPLEDYNSFRSGYCSTHRGSSTYSVDDGRSTLGSGYCESVSSSLSSSTTTTCSSRFVRKVANIEASGDISTFNISVASITAVILHEDILLACSNPDIQGSPLSEESEVNMLEISNYFFSCIDEKAGLVGFTCKKNHLMFYAAPIIAEGIQQRSKNMIMMKCTASMTRVDLNEVLECVATPLIKFDRTQVVDADCQKRPEVIVRLKTTTPSNPSNRKRRIPIPPRTEVDFDLDKCTAEMDISIYDRLSALFCSSPFSNTIDPPPAEEIKKNESRHLDPITEFNVTSSVLNLRLRFPIADIRPIHDPNRVPWWKQNVRPDSLYFSFYQFRMKHSLMFEIMANEIDAYYEPSLTAPRIHLLKSNLVNNTVPTLNEPNVDYPKVTLEFPSEKTLDTLLKCCNEDSDSGETSGEGFDLYARRSREYVPFSSKRVCRQSATPHATADTPEKSETVLLPGDIHEMGKFCDTAMKTSKLQIKISLPTGIVQVISKQLYEIIYNRVNTDLLMWEPSSPSFSRNKKPPPAPTIEQSLLNIGLMDSMYVPSTSPVHPYDNDDDIKYEKSESLSDGIEPESGQSDNDTESIYYSTYEKKKTKRNQLPPPTLHASTCSFELTMGKGLLSLFSPVRDAENRVLPNQLGEYTILTEGFRVFSVNGFNGNDNLGYLCVNSRDAKVFHCGLIPSRDSEPGFPDFSGVFPSHMQSTVYPTPNDLTKGVGEGSINREMLSLAIEIQKIPDQYVKRLKITAGIQKATLRHNPTNSRHGWLHQLLDFLDVADYPIEGYKPYGIITEMELHLWDCAIDYRPKNFDHRSVIEIGYFSTSSNIISTTPGCTLRFIAEECVLSLAPFLPKESEPQNKITVLPASELVPVVDLGLVDISLRLNEKTTESNPKFDLRTSMQDVHVRSCYDSGRALFALLNYVAGNGDVNSEDEDCMSSSFGSSVYSDAGLFSMKDRKNSVPNISTKQQERVTLLISEALRETVTSAFGLKDEAEHKFDRGVEIFFFPDESQQSSSEKDAPTAGPSGSAKSRDPSPPRKTAASPPQGEEQVKEGQSTPGLSRTNSSTDDWAYQFRHDSASSNELQEILDFETSVMKKSYMQVQEDDAVEALPQVREELGDIKQRDKPSPSMRKSSIGLDDDFCVIAEEEKTYLSQCGIKDVKVSEDPLRMVDNHFKLPAGKPDLLQAPENFPMAEYRYTLCEMTLTWHLYGGNDFPIKSSNKSADKDSKDKENTGPEEQSSMSDAFKQGVSNSSGTQKIQTGKKPKEKLSWRTAGGYKRDHEKLVEIQLGKVRCSHEIYPKHTHQASRQVLVISELEVRDRLQTSDINKFLYHPSAKHLPNKSSKNLLVVKALNVRPHPRTSISQECSLRVSLLPLRLNIDQDTLLFLVDFFSELSCFAGFTSTGKRRNSSSHQPPVMMVGDMPEPWENLQARRMVSTNLDLLMDGDEKERRRREEEEEEDEEDDYLPETSNRRAPIYFKEVIFSPEVNIRLDYHGRRVEMSRGPIAGLVMGLGQLQCSEIKLKKIVYKHGLLGIDKLIEHLCKEWLQDIKKNQLSNILSGVGPAHAFVQLFQGFYDLFRLPFEQYQKDGRFVRGLQLGAQSFTARTALAALEITSRIIQLLQFTAETAYDMVSPGPSVRSVRHNRKGKRKRPHRPQDIREGVVNAYQIVKDGINDSANALIETAVVEHDQKGYTGAVGGIIRQIPQLVVQPAVLATQATTHILGGVKSSLVPDAKLEAREKWKEDSD